MYERECMYMNISYIKTLANGTITKRMKKTQSREITIVTCQHSLFYDLLIAVQHQLGSITYIFTTKTRLQTINNIDNNVGM